MSGGLLDRRLTRRLRRAVRATVGGDPALRAERRRIGRPGRRLFQDWMLHPVVAVVLWTAGGESLRNPQNALVLILLALVLTLMRVAGIRAALADVPTMAACAHLPVQPRSVFRHQLRPELLKLAWFAVDCLAFATGAGLAAGIGWWQWAVLPLWAGAEVLALITVAVWLVAALDRLTPRMLLAGVMAGGVAGLLAWFRADLHLPAVGFTVFDLLRVATPGGWLQGAFDLLMHGQVEGLVVPAAVLAGGAVLLPLGLLRLERRFTLPALFDGPPPAADPTVGTETGPEAAAPAVDDGTPRASGPVPPVAQVIGGDADTVRDRWRTVAALAPGHTLARHGLIGLAACRLLPARLRTVADVLVYDGNHCGRIWTVALACVLAAHLLVASGLGWPFATGPLLAIAALCALPLAGGAWRGLGREAGSSNVAFLAFVPVGLGQVTRVVLTFNAVRVVAALPLLLLATPIVVHWSRAVDPLCVAGFKAAWLMLTAQPLLLALRFTQSADATPFFRLSNIPAVMAYALLILGALPLVGGLFMGDPVPAALCAVALIPVGSALLLATRWNHRRGTLDLIALPART